MVDFKTFSENYIQHLDWLQANHPCSADLTRIYELFSSVNQNGGWVRTIGLNNWQQISSIESPRLFFEKSYLVSFERVLKKAWPYDADFTKSLDFSRLKPVEITKNVRSDQWEELLSEHLVLFRDVYQLGISKDLISLDSLKKKHGKVEIPIVVQESDTSGFSIKKAIKQKMKLKEYISLMENARSDDKCIRFAVNIDFGNWKEEVDELRKFLPSEILWCSDNDSLRHLRQHILGMSLPQLYLKISGCWTGGHEENLRFPAANINHGPSACEWWGLDPTQSLQLRECVKVDKGFEIYNSETLWWPDEIYCISKGLNVYHVIQDPGDLILVGLGTIHWVKSCGVTTNTAWNFGPKYLNNFKSSFERDFINKAISFKSLVPMHILSLDLINNELETLDIALVEFLKEQIIYKNGEESQEFIDSQLPKPELNGDDNVVNCEICYQELFRYYYKCSKCIQQRFKGKSDICFFCYLCATRIHSIRCKGSIVAVQKFNDQHIERLVKKIEMRCEGNDCKGNVPELKYPYDKNIEENIYVSLFNGVKYASFIENSNPAVSETRPTISIISNEEIKEKMISTSDAEEKESKKKPKAKKEKKLKSKTFKKTMPVYPGQYKSVKKLVSELTKELKKAPDIGVQRKKSLKSSKDTVEKEIVTKEAIEENKESPQHEKQNAPDLEPKSPNLPLPPPTPESTSKNDILLANTTGEIDFLKSLPFKRTIRSSDAFCPVAVLIPKKAKAE